MAGKVEARINEIRAELAKKSLWSRMDSVETLKTIANSTEKGGDKIAAVKDGDKIAAVKVLNEMHGYNAPIKTEVKHEGEITHEIRPKLTRDEWLRIHGL